MAICKEKHNWRLQNKLVGKKLEKGTLRTEKQSWARGNEDSTCNGYMYLLNVAYKFAFKILKFK